jgi:LacI family transcriptional regulator
LRRWVALAMEYYIPQVHEGVTAYALQAGWWGGLNQIWLPFQAARLSESWDGVLALPWISLREDLKRCRCPSVQMYQTPEPGTLAAVCPDWKGIGAAGARHLLERGHTTLVFYRRSLQAEAVLMQQGFQEEVARVGLATLVLDRPAEQPEVEDVQSTRLTRLPWLTGRLATLPRPLGIMAEDDRFALDVVCACETLRLRIPQDVAVLGADNDPRVINLSPVPLSSVDTNQSEVGYRAAELLDRLMGGQRPDRTQRLVPPLRVVVRESTDTYTRGGADTQAAYALIRQHCTQKISSEEIAAKVGIPSRTLQLHFKRETGRTMSQELSRLRLEHALQLLDRTPLKISTIAHETGFASYAHFCSLFARQFGLTPREYRQRTRADGGP